MNSQGWKRVFLKFILGTGIVGHHGMLPPATLSPYTSTSLIPSYSTSNLALC